MTASTATTSSEDDVSWRIQGAVYGIGLFSKRGCSMRHTVTL